MYLSLPENDGDVPDEGPRGEDERAVLPSALSLPAPPGLREEAS